MINYTKRLNALLFHSQAVSKLVEEFKVSEEQAAKDIKAAQKKYHDECDYISFNK